jgi:hypothetical protein
MPLHDLTICRDSCVILASDSNPSHTGVRSLGIRDLFYCHCSHGTRIHPGTIHQWTGPVPSLFPSCLFLAAPVYKSWDRWLVSKRETSNHKVDAFAPWTSSENSFSSPNVSFGQTPQTRPLPMMSKTRNLCYVLRKGVRNPYSLHPGGFSVTLGSLSYRAPLNKHSF